MTKTPSRRVCVTGLGIVTPLGHNINDTWTSLMAGKSGASKITHFDAETWPTSFACEVKNFKLDPDALMSDFAEILNRPTEFGMQAAFEAMHDAGFADGGYQRDRFGISVGAGIGTISPHELAFMLKDMQTEMGLTNLFREVERNSNKSIVLRNHPAALGALLGARWWAEGPVTTIHTACASSGQSVGQAWLQIKRGEADVMLAGGADSLAGELLLAGFCLLGALSRRNNDPAAGSRPFDKDRDGFVAGEGAGMLVLEEYEHAKKRGAKIYAEISGYGETASAFRITDLPPDGRGIVEAMEEAVKSAGLNHADVGYINAHGTSTELNDRVEALAIRRVFGEKGCRPMVSSTKSQVGHLISAAGAVESVFTTLAVHKGEIPASINLYNPDDPEHIDFVANTPRKVPIKAAISNSIGFGGTNSCVLVERARS
jgi:beta-ketoacyl-acyl-carrier-protein synthase II